MIRKTIQILSLLALNFFVVACSTKSDELFNLSAASWYEQIVKDLQARDLEKADEHYTAMSSEHIADPLLETTQLILAQAHIDEEEYELADFYLEENAKRFGNAENIDFIRYSQIKAKFEAFYQPFRDQGLMLTSLNQIDEFLNTYPNTEFAPLVDTMLTKFNLGVYVLDEEIASLYRRTGRDESYEIYQQKLNDSAFKDVPMIKPKQVWYRRIFE